MARDTDIVRDENFCEEKRHSFNELDSFRSARLRTFSHWPHETPSGDKMSANGWFSCNVADRVICLYCETICHGWTHDDDPEEVHARLAPHCPFVHFSSSSASTNPLPIVNDTFGQNALLRHSSMGELPHRYASFNTAAWTQSSPSVDDLVRAGFFFSGSGTTVSCFCCGGSVEKWDVNDNPTVEHARSFPQCSYIKQLCGDRLYAQIQLFKKKHSSQKTIDPTLLARLVAARLDLPVVQNLRSLYRLSIIKRCIEDQLTIKSQFSLSDVSQVAFVFADDDFASDTDLAIACRILQKQIDLIQGNKDKLIVPSANQVMEIPSISSNSSTGECVVCLSEQRQLACMPCGHLCTCVTCGNALRTCPICRHPIRTFVRIYS